jgi:ribosomal protein S12 methylthiotransferase accessory factor YcaO
VPPDRYTNYTRSCARAVLLHRVEHRLASGNHRHEAASHALCEVVERDAKARFRTLMPDEQAPRKLDLASVDDPDCRDALDRFERAGVTVAVWDLDSQVGLPVYECLIVDSDDDAAWTQVPASGCGCHPTRGIALLRALTEAAQSRLRPRRARRHHAQRLPAHLRPCQRSRARALLPAPALRRRADHDHASFDEDLALTRPVAARVPTAGGTDCRSPVRAERGPRRRARLISVRDDPPAACHCLSRPHAAGGAGDAASAESRQVISTARRARGRGPSA